ncbi:DUF6119 family protein [Pseudomonas aeruginosa]|uniref:DUF6119 family protein n=1 Tax=Pseudomonas aeruginosa TaxID=287 RepID=UPI0029360CAE|nr:DUF6119 family protein [Pseudomonas aeruginosa]MDV2774949.1 DUF6119 family protein [Pseudomonas aeruginosa]
MSLEKLTVYKIKEHITSFDEFINETDGKRRPLPPLRPIRIENAPAGVEVQASFSHKKHETQKTAADVPWIVFINEGTDEPINFNCRNTFPCAVVAIKITTQNISKFYALTFGLGAETFLDNEKIVRDFGLRVAMNICDTEKLRRIQTNIHEAVSTHAERQISTGSNLSVFQINDEKEFLRSVTGVARAEYNFIKSFTGKDNITLKIKNDNPLNWESLIPKLQTLEDAYNQDNYLQVFQGYSKFHFENDPNTIQQLDSEVFERIRNGNFENIHLSPPEFTDFESRYFTYKAEGGDQHDDLSVDDFITSRRAFSDRSSINSLKTHKIYVWSSETGNKVTSWPVYRCLVAEIELNNDTYILSMAQWKKVSTDFKQEVEDYVSDIPSNQSAYLTNNVSIWDAQRNQNREEIYNQELYNTNNDIFLFDKAKVHIAGERIYEVCDLLHSDKSLIHVKRLKSGSASISHLFLQGKFYSDAFISDQKCRESMREHITENHNERPTQAFTDILPDNRNDIVTNDYTIIFCILTEKADPDINSLPFMARYELMHSHKHINQALGFKCEYKLVSVVLGPP